MQHSPDRSFIGFGRLGGKPWQAQRGFEEVGNSTELKIQHATEKKSLRNFRTGIGNNNSKTTVTAITGSYTLYDSGANHLASVLRSKVKVVAAGIVTGEAHPTGGLTGELIVFKNLVDTSKPITVLIPPATATATAANGNVGDGAIGTVTVNGAASGEYDIEFTSSTAFTVSGTGGALGTGTVGVAFTGGGLNFTVTAGNTAFASDDAFTIEVAAGTEAESGIDYLTTHYGIQLLAGSAIGQRGVVVSYTKGEATVAEILKAAPTEQTLHFAGLNDAQDGKPYDVTLHRVSFDVISELPLNGADYVAYNVTFELLQDYTRVGADESQFYTIREAV